MERNRKKKRRSWLKWKTILHTIYYWFSWLLFPIEIFSWIPSFFYLQTLSFDTSSKYVTFIKWLQIAKFCGELNHIWPKYSRQINELLIKRVRINNGLMNGLCIWIMENIGLLFVCVSSIRLYSPFNMPVYVCGTLQKKKTAMPAEKLNNGRTASFHIIK